MVFYASRSLVESAAVARSIDEVFQTADVS